MRKLMIVLILLFHMSISMFAQNADYNGGNGTVLRTENTAEGDWIIRQHQQELEIGDLSRGHDLNIYNEKSLESEILGSLELGDTIFISQLAERQKNKENIVWLFIENQDGVKGWLLFGRPDSQLSSFSNPYLNNRWAIIDRIEVNNRTWTIRKLNPQLVSINVRLNIRDLPGVNGSQVIGLIILPEDRFPQVNVDVSAITEEKETIDGRTDSWLKIEYEDITGWVFGGYASVERGGPKYYTPESIIRFQLGYY